MYLGRIASPNENLVNVSLGQFSAFAHVLSNILHPESTHKTRDGTKNKETIFSTVHFDDASFAVPSISHMN